MFQDVKRVYKKNMTGPSAPPVDPTFRTISKTSTAFLVWRIEVGYIIKHKAITSVISYMFLRCFYFISYSRLIKYVYFSN